MQSFRQYRQLGETVRAQYKRNKERLNLDNAQSEGPNQGFDRPGSPNTSPGSSISPDPEKADSTSQNPGLGKEVEAEDGRDVEKTNSPNGIPAAELQQSSSNQLIPSLTGIEIRRRMTREGPGQDKVFIVGFQGDDDPLNPHNWSRLRRWVAVLNVAAVGWIVGFSSSIDSGALPQAAREFGVTEVTESLATGLFLIAFGLGALIAGPFSEEFGRNPVYIGNMILFMVFVMASGLAPNIGAQLVFRFIAGIFASTPLTCAGGSVSDLFSPLERVYVFPMFANAAFQGPIIGPIVGGFIGESSLVSWRFVEWITLIISGCILASIILIQPETYGPILLKWKAAHLREVTGDARYVAAVEVRTETFLHRVRRALYRPFLLAFRESIVMLFGLYLTVIYIILFTFLNGYTFIFTETYGLSQGITGLLFLGISTGLAMSLLLVPHVKSRYGRQLRKAEEQEGISRLPPEVRLRFAMFGAPAVPISLFWMGWTARADISVASPILASVLFGYGTLCIFISCYQYLIDSYELYAASALASVTVVRYVVSGGLVVAAIPIYEGLSVHWTLTLMGGLSALMVPVPYLFMVYGEKIRGYSKYAVGE